MDREALHGILDEVRATGIARDFKENDHGVVCLGARVFMDRRIVASLSVSIPSSRHTHAIGESISRVLRRLDLGAGQPPAG